MFGFSKSDRSSEMGAYHMAAECELMNLEEMRIKLLEVLDTDLTQLEGMPEFTRDDAEACMIEIMQDYDERAPEISAAIRGNLKPYLEDATAKGLGKQFDEYLKVRLDMFRFNLAFRAMNKQTAFCERHELPSHEA
jgi:hypothetical protein